MPLKREIIEFVRATTATLFFAAVLVLTPSAAGSPEKDVVAKLAGEAETIVRGRVIASEARWDAERRFIESVSTIAPDYTVFRTKGADAPTTYGVVTLGGALPEEGLGLSVTHSPTLAPGEEVLLFLRPESPRNREHRIHGGLHGKYSVKDGAAVSAYDDSAWPLKALLTETATALATAGREATLPSDWERLEADAAARATEDSAPRGTPTFVYSGHKWPGTDPMEEFFFVHLNSIHIDRPGRGSDQDFLNNILAAAAVWGLVEKAQFQFRWGGFTGANVVSRNEVNEVFFDIWDDGSGLPPIGQTFQWWGTAQGEMREADTRFNDTYNLTTNFEAGGLYDLRTLAAHEFGHWLYLQHDPSFKTIMYGILDALEKKHYPFESDVAGIEFIYPHPNPPAPTPPPNNDLAAAQPIGGGFTIVGNTRHATRDGDFFGCQSIQTGPDVWFEYTPATDGIVEFNMCGSGMFAVLEVFTDCRAGFMKRVACTDQGCGPTSTTRVPRLSVELRGGIRYIVRVAGRGSGEVGFFTLGVTGPPAGQADPEGLVLQHLLGENPDARHLDLNCDGEINVADIVREVNSAGQ